MEPQNVHIDAGSHSRQKLGCAIEREMFEDDIFYIHQKLNNNIEKSMETCNEFDCDALVGHNDDI